MSDLESIDVTSTDEKLSTDCFHAASSQSEKCSYCGCDRDGLTVFHCTVCTKWIHSSCLHCGSPSPLLADNFYNFQCVACTSNGKEKFERVKLTWNAATSLALYNLAHTSQGKNGYFRWKEDICAFIDQHWDVFFDNSRKKTGTWMNTVASTMSSGNPHQFLSGYADIREPGWWKLTSPHLPAEYKPTSDAKKCADVISLKKIKPRRSRNLAMTPVGNVVDGLRKRNYHSSAANASHIKQKRSRMELTPSPSSLTSKGLNASPGPGVSAANESSSSHESLPSFKGCISPVSSPLSSPRPNSVTSMLSKCDMVPGSSLPLAILSDDSSDNESTSNQQFNELPPLPIVWSAPTSPGNRSRSTSVDMVQRPRTPDVQMLNNQPPLLWDQQMEATNQEEEKAKTNLPPAPVWRKLNLYEEDQLLKKMLSMNSAVDEDATARRLRRKLLLRNKKRSLNLPVFDYETVVLKHMAAEKGIVLDEETNDIPPFHIQTVNSVQTGPYRILDRFQTNAPTLMSTISDLHPTFEQRLVGTSVDVLQQPTVSSYTQRVLKPFIRRDFDSTPKKLAVLREIKSVHHKTHELAEPATDPIDYCYVQPYHISTINSICQHYFWPGVDLSECLNYPDFTVVALYKKMVVGFGIMVPDVGFKEAYISYLFVHPDWRRGGIASFMIYHLIQTCMGKDITLHVSASNPAMLLYQKFGFKPEKFIADFYDKYYPVGSTLCKHAFFMRMKR